MVKVSFNSALAQKDAAKKEEDEEGGQNEKNSCSNQVLILSPDTKVRRSPAPASAPAEGQQQKRAVFPGAEQQFILQAAA